MRHLVQMVIVVLLVSSFGSAYAEAGPPPKSPVDFDSPDPVTFSMYCPRTQNQIQVTLVPRVPTSTYFDPGEFQGYQIQPFANPTIEVEIWLTHSGWSETAANPSDIIRQCIQGGNDSTYWNLSSETQMWEYIDELQKNPVIVTQGDHITTFNIHAATVIPHDMMGEYSQDIRNIPGILARIDPRFETLLQFYPEKPPVQDYFLITCLWGPYGESWGIYSKVHEYYSYSRLVIWLTPAADNINSTPIP